MLVIEWLHVLHSQRPSWFIPFFLAYWVVLFFSMKNSHLDHCVVILAHKHIRRTPGLLYFFASLPLFPSLGVLGALGGPPGWDHLMYSKANPSGTQDRQSRFWAKSLLLPIFSLTGLNPEAPAPVSLCPRLLEPLLPLTSIFKPFSFMAVDSLSSKSLTNVSLL